MKKEQKTSIWSWGLSKEELKNQIENYNTLSFTKSLRKLSVGLIFFSVTLGMIFIIMGSQEISWIDTIIWILLAIFIYKGKKWAVVSAMILWTMEKGYQVYGMIEIGSGSVLAVILWWSAYMNIFYKTWIVEKERNKAVQPNIIKSIDSQLKNIFCDNCGKPIKTGSNFCNNCGNKLI